ncbi:FAD-binding domain-containing protein [Aspergillus ellipticus CBS 707.79]|uniref:FAD-binding domain-containing protein n=1 Tax=Aspergillus ellipticus CBS 707.79 TaxID=1448320 RepID=A0A319D799_9EURO|nr:FAD-binding domain-containing protein [Aspergillus ellipticus CBS 707.79]
MISHHGLLLTGLLAWPALGNAAVRAHTRSCRCLPTEECWPSPAEWAHFNSSVDGSLIQTTPLGTPCHAPSYDADVCDEFREEWNVPEIHYQSSSSVMAPWFANGSCDPFHPIPKPCTLGNYISYAVNVSHPGHISRALAFVTAHNLRLVIRNTGHDYQGKSTGAGALGVWTHHLKDIQIHPHHQDAHYTGPAATLGAGVQAFEAYQAADDHGYQIVGGECPTVGIAGGYTQGGGHSALSSRYGLAADQVLKWEVIDGAGNFLTATRDNEHSDLFWALSGGGGGTYGVVWSMTSKLHASTPTSGLNLTFTNANISQDTFYEAVTLFHSHLPTIVDAGVMSIFALTNTTFGITPLTGPGIPVAELESLIQPFRDDLDTLGIAHTMHTGQFDTYLDQFEAMMIDVPVGIAQYGGWLIPRSVVRENNAALTDACRQITENGGYFVGVGLNVAKGPGEVYNAVLPAWRDALIHTVLSTPWEWDNGHEMLVNQYKMTHEFVSLLERLAPRSGAYLNEGDFLQPNFQQAFYGENYPRLRRVKAKYDPNDIFYAWTGVGSDEWVGDDADGRLCRAGGHDLVSQEGYGYY